MATFRQILSLTLSGPSLSTDVRWNQSCWRHLAAQDPSRRQLSRCSTCSPRQLQTAIASSIMPERGIPMRKKSFARYLQSYALRRGVEVHSGVRCGVHSPRRTPFEREPPGPVQTGRWILAPAPGSGALSLAFRHTATAKNLFRLQ